MSSFNAVKLTDKVYWVGAIDNEVRNFHGYETSRGTTYNAYLILGEKNILIDTVKAPFFMEMMARIKSVIEPDSIDYIISNHAEMDHSGCLPKVIDLVKPEKIFASGAGIQALRAHFHFDIEIEKINNNETFTLGDSEFRCVETKMLHWPDSMFTYFANDKVLFSQDGFGMHLATNKLLASDNDIDVMEYEAKKYFANILLPYAPMVTKLCNVFPSLDLDVSLVAPDHGPVWDTQENIGWIMRLWETWAQQKSKHKAVIAFDTMWGSTAKMAKVIADGLMSANIDVKLMSLSVCNRSDIITELLDAGLFLLGSPTLNQQMYPTVADLLCYIQGLKPKNLKGQAFGSYGWSGESIKHIQEAFQSMGVELLGESMKAKYVPDDEVLEQCQDFGIKMAEILLNE
jgi:flavorubredoxin